MCIIYRFVEEAPPGKSPWTKETFLSIVCFSLDEIPKIKICHMLAKEHPEAIGGRRRLIDVDVTDSVEAVEDASIYHYGDDLNEEDGSGLVGAGVTEEVADMQKALKYSFIFPYMLKPSHLLTHGFDNNRTAHNNILKHMCNFGAWK